MNALNNYKIYVGIHHILISAICMSARAWYLYVLRYYSVISRVNKFLYIRTKLIKRLYWTRKIYCICLLLP